MPSALACSSAPAALLEEVAEPSWRTSATLTGGASKGAGTAQPAAAALALALGGASLALGWALGLAPVDGARAGAPDWEQAVATRATTRPRTVSARGTSRRGGWVYGSLLDTRISKAAGMGWVSRCCRDARPTGPGAVRRDRRQRSLDTRGGEVTPGSRTCTVRGDRRHQNASPRGRCGAVSATTTCHRGGRRGQGVGPLEEQPAGDADDPPRPRNGPARRATRCR